MRRKQELELTQARQYQSLHKMREMDTSKYQRFYGKQETKSKQEIYASENQSACVIACVSSKQNCTVYTRCEKLTEASTTGSWKWDRIGVIVSQVPMTCKQVLVFTLASAKVLGIKLWCHASYSVNANKSWCLGSVLQCLREQPIISSQPAVMCQAAV